MKVLWSAYYEFLKSIRDIRLLIALIICPISIILILGTIFNNNLTEDFKGKIPIGYVLMDKAETGKGIESLLVSPEISKLITAKRLNTQKEAQKAVSTGKIDNYFIAGGEAATVKIEGKKNIELVQSLLEGYLSKSKAYSVVMNITQEPVQVEAGNYFERITTKNRKLPKAIDYYSVLTLLQLTSLGAVLGIFIVNRNKESNIHIRLYALPVSKWTIISGKVIGDSLFLFISCLVTVAFTKFAYGANWDGNLIIISLALLAFSVISIGTGILLGSFTKSMISAVGIAFLYMFATSISGGSITPALSTPIINFVNPLYYTKVLIFGALYGYPAQVMLKAASALLLMIAAVYLLSFWKLRRVNYDNI